MKPPSPSDYPELRRAFSGYLHEDFLEEHDSAVDALGAFQDDANPAERRRFLKEMKRFLEETEGLNFAEVKTLLTRLGARWTPASRQALVALLNSLGQRTRPRRS